MLIDWKRVVELKSEIGSEDFNEIVELFLEEVEGELSKLSSSQAHDKLEAQLHFLKGSALNLGFTEFSRLCQAGETAASAGQKNSVPLSEIATSYEISKCEFLNFLNSSTAI